MNKQDIFNNVASISASDLAKYIYEGIVTFDELVHETYQFDANKRKQVNKELALLEHADDNAFKRACDAGTKKAFQEYLNKYPTGKHREEARERLESYDDDNAFATACDAGTKEAFQEYLDKYPTGKHREEARERLNEIKVDEAWKKINKKDFNALQDFIVSYPTSRHVKEAKKLQDEILIRTPLKEQIEEIYEDWTLTDEEQDNKIVNLLHDVPAQDILNMIKEYHSLFYVHTVKQLISVQKLSHSDLQAINVPNSIIKLLLKNYTIPALPEGTNKPQFVPGRTEVYFWGVPSSGKTCTLAALLSVLRNGGKYTAEFNPNSGGYGCMTMLAEWFNAGNAARLMSGTPNTSFYEMGITLTPNGDNKYNYPLTFIDMAGELMRSLYWSLSDPNRLTEEMKNMLDVMNSYLINNATGNRKIHCFIIEYGAESKQQDGVSQRAYLDGAIEYLKGKNTFKKDTDAIFLVLTKADMIRPATENTVSDYIQEKYAQICQLLKLICKENSISGGKLVYLPFSIGDVYFRDYCVFDPKPAKVLIEQIIQQAAKKRISRFNIKLR